MLTQVDPTNYFDAWNECRRLSILYDRAMEQLMEELQVERISELEEKLLEQRGRGTASGQALLLERRMIALERDLEKAEETLAIANKLRQARQAVDNDLLLLEC